MVTPTHYGERRPADTTHRIDSVFKSLATKLLLLLASSAVCIAVVEFSLRAFAPRFQYAAESQSEESPGRIWVRRKFDEYERKHPDTEQTFTVHHNNLALRHARDFTPESLAASVNIGFFGDSFTENLRLQGPYVFTEVLDFLLNTHAPPVNVLNFGVDGYGTDQAYVTYQEFESAADLDHVFYVFCVNDIRNVYENNLFSLDAEGGLVTTPARPSPWWIRSASGLYSTYYLLEALQRTGSHKRVVGAKDLEEYYQSKHRRGERDERFHDTHADSMEQALLDGTSTVALEDTLAVFHALLRTWRASVEARGAAFHIVFLPREDEHVVRGVIPDDFEVLDLYEAFDERIPDYDYGDWRFVQDGHWNENGNLLAAVVLLRALEADFSGAPLSEQSLREALFTYYSSLGDFMPEAEFLHRVDIDPDLSRSLRMRYGPADRTD